MRWLHLSDLHIPAKNSADRKERYDVFISLCTYLTTNFKGKIDYVFVTGDIRHARDEEPLSAVEAAQELKRLANGIEVKTENVYFVPGNHDLDRTEGWQELRAAYQSSGAGTDKWSRWVKERFTFYHDFIREFYGVRGERIWGEMSEHMHTTVHLSDTIQLLLLNTAIFACDSETDKGNLCIGTKYLLPCLQELQSGKLTFVLAHHHPGFLCDKDYDFLFDERKLSGGNQYLAPLQSFYLCGHTHSSFVSKHGPFQHVITVGCSCIEPQENVENQFCIGIENAGRVDCKYYTYDKKNFEWQETPMTADSAHFSSKDLTLDQNTGYIRWKEDSRSRLVAGIFSVPNPRPKMKISRFPRKSEWKVNIWSNVTDEEKLYSYHYRKGSKICHSSCQLSNLKPYEEHVDSITFRTQSKRDVLFINNKPLSFTYTADSHDKTCEITGIINIAESTIFARHYYGENEDDENGFSNEQLLTPNQLARHFLNEISTDILEKEGETEDSICSFITEKIKEKSLESGVKLCPKVIEFKYKPINATFTPTSTIVGIGDSITFNPDVNSENTSYHWDFGERDATSDEVCPSYTYQKPGKKTVTLTITKGSEKKSETYTILVCGKAEYSYGIIVDGENPGQKVFKSIIKKNTLIQNGEIRGEYSINTGKQHTITINVAKIDSTDSKLALLCKNKILVNPKTSKDISGRYITLTGREYFSENGFIEESLSNEIKIVMTLTAHGTLSIQCYDTDSELIHEDYYGNTFNWNPLKC